MLGLCVFSMAPLAAAPPAFAQSVTGTNGLVMIPTARMHPDGTLVAGGGFVDGRYSGYVGRTANERLDYSPFYASVTYLPFLEVGLRFSRAHSGTPVGLGDRMLLVRARVLKERGWMPDLAVGAHDFLRSSENQTSNFNALYAVASKAVPLPAAAERWGVRADVHLGYGTDAMEARGHQFVGVFGGASATAFEDAGYLSGWTLMAEYDGTTATVGQRLSLLGAIDLMAALQGLRVPVFTIGAHYTL